MPPKKAPGKGGKVSAASACSGKGASVIVTYNGKSGRQQLAAGFKAESSLKDSSWDQGSGSKTAPKPTRPQHLHAKATQAYTAESQESKLLSVSFLSDFPGHAGSGYLGLAKAALTASLPKEWLPFNQTQVKAAVAAAKVPLPASSWSAPRGKAHASLLSAASLSASLTATRTSKASQVPSSSWLGMPPPPKGTVKTTASAKVTAQRESIQGTVSAALGPVSALHAAVDEDLSGFKHARSALSASMKVSCAASVKKQRGCKEQDQVNVWHALMSSGRPQVTPSATVSALATYTLTPQQSTRRALQRQLRALGLMPQRGTVDPIFPSSPSSASPRKAVDVDRDARVVQVSLSPSLPLLAAAPPKAKKDKPATLGTLTSSVYIGLLHPLALVATTVTTASAAVPSSLAFPADGVWKASSSPAAGLLATDFRVKHASHIGLALSSSNWGTLGVGYDAAAGVGTAGWSVCRKWGVQPSLRTPESKTAAPTNPAGRKGQASDKKTPLVLSASQEEFRAKLKAPPARPSEHADWERAVGIVGVAGGPKSPTVSVTGSVGLQAKKHGELRTALLSGQSVLDAWHAKLGVAIEAKPRAAAWDT